MTPRECESTLKAQMEILYCFISRSINQPLQFSVFSLDPCYLSWTSSQESTIENKNWQTKKGWVCEHGWEIYKYSSIVGDVSWQINKWVNSTRHFQRATGSSYTVTVQMSLLAVIFGFLTLLTFLHGIWFPLPILFSAAILGWSYRGGVYKTPQPPIPCWWESQGWGWGQAREKERDGMALKWERLATWKVREKCYGRNSSGMAG